MVKKQKLDEAAGNTGEQDGIILFIGFGQLLAKASVVRKALIEGVFASTQNCLPESAGPVPLLAKGF